MKMLHCIQAPGTAQAQRRLFIRSSLLCDFTGWQLPATLCLALLLATPALLPVVATWSRRAPLRDHHRIRFVDDLRTGINLALVISYKPSTYWWESILMTQRLVRTIFCNSSKPASNILMLIACPSICLLATSGGCYRVHVLVERSQLAGHGLSAALHRLYGRPPGRAALASSGGALLPSNAADLFDWCRSVKHTVRRCDGGRDRGTSVVDPGLHLGARASAVVWACRASSCISLGLLWCLD
jgi:hypothetical protein